MDASAELQKMLDEAMAASFNKHVEIASAMLRDQHNLLVKHQQLAAAQESRIETLQQLAADKDAMIEELKRMNAGARHTVEIYLERMAHLEAEVQRVLDVDAVRTDAVKMQ